MEQGNPLVNLPVAPATPTGQRQARGWVPVSVACPFCGGQHGHGLFLDTDDPQVRVASCDRRHHPDAGDWYRIELDQALDAEFAAA